MKKEKGPEYYTQMYNQGYSTDRYREIYAIAATFCNKKKVLDIGCGLGNFKDYLPKNAHWDGFDFADIPGIRKGNLFKEDLKHRDVYCLFEVLEHLDNDLRALRRIPVGKDVLFSVPTFPDKSHVRTFGDLEEVEDRYDKLIDFKATYCFIWDNKNKVHKVVDAHDISNATIYLVHGKRKKVARKKKKEPAKPKSSKGDFTLGAYMIVKNEEEMLGQCLESIKDLDEIIILDTGSTDKTGEVVEKFQKQFKGNFKYIVDIYKWDQHYSEARNKAMEYTTADWLLIIDADELLIGGVAYLRKSIKKHPDEKAFNFWTISQSNPNKKHPSVRLHKNLPKEIYWKDRWHNYLTITKGPFTEAEIHYGYSPAHNKEPDRALNMGLRAIKEEPENTRYRYYLAREYWYKHNYHKAIEHLIIYFHLGGGWASEKADAHLIASQCYWFIRNIDEAWNHAFLALRINADFKEAYELLASMSGPKNKTYWSRNAELATNKDVLFIRS